MPPPSYASLQQRVRELEDAVRARDDFLAIAAHELRSPLNALALRLALLERMASQRTDPALLAEIQAARRSADHYVRRAVVLLDVSRLNSGGAAPVRKPVDIRTLVLEVVDSHRDEAAAYGAALTADIAADGVGLWDRQMVEQLLSNLVGNAVKYGHGTPVRVAADVVGDVARLEVIDAGPGIPEEQRSRIFARFERLVSGGPYRSGYGLGLWIVGQLVQAHGGRIEVESAPGQGSVFRVHLPLREDGTTGETAT
ncbi:MAG TPA: HAMP domain-containing sensor histidine kinase [Ramlibacter sp.]|nr:HAMP domain-containing sensor histidine kinase [Ramlibacter sp.]